MKRGIHALLLSLFLITTGHASNLRFLHDVGPISDFKKGDTDMLWDTIVRALDTAKDGEKLTWENKETGNSGLVNPLSSYRENETECRNLRLVNRSSKHIAETKYKFCKKDNKWIAIELIK